jgi:hypothetical protein
VQAVVDVSTFLPHLTQEHSQPQIMQQIVTMQYLKSE